MTPEEAVEAAARAIYGVSRSALESQDEFSDEWATWEQASENKKAQDRKEARAALEAVAPYMLAEPGSNMQEAMRLAWDEGAAAYATRYERDESLPLTNPYRSQP